MLYIIATANLCDSSPQTIIIDSLLAKHTKILSISYLTNSKKNITCLLMWWEPKSWHANTNKHGLCYQPLKCSTFVNPKIQHNRNNKIKVSFLIA